MPNKLGDPDRVARIYDALNEPAGAGGVDAIRERRAIRDGAVTIGLGLLALGLAVFEATPR